MHSSTRPVRAPSPHDSSLDATNSGLPEVRSASSRRRQEDLCRTDLIRIRRRESNCLPVVQRKRPLGAPRRKSRKGARTSLRPGRASGGRLHLILAQSVPGLAGRGKNIRRQVLGQTLRLHETEGEGLQIPRQERLVRKSRKRRALLSDRGCPQGP